MNRPALSGYDQTNERLSYSKSHSDISLKKLPGGIKSANLNRNIGCDFGGTVAFTGKRRVAPTPLRCHFPHIIELSSKSEVVGIDAPGIIATVKDHHSWRNSLLCHLKAKSMGAGNGAIHAKHSVSAGVMSRRPVPAPVRLVNLRPKAFFDSHMEIIPC